MTHGHMCHGQVDKVQPTLEMVITSCRDGQGPSTYLNVAAGDLCSSAAAPRLSSVQLDASRWTRRLNATQGGSSEPKALAEKELCREERHFPRAFAVVVVVVVVVVVPFSFFTF